MGLTGAIPKQSNSAVQIWQPPWLNLRRKPELDLLPLELDFLYGDIIVKFVFLVFKKAVYMYVNKYKHMS